MNIITPQLALLPGDLALSRFEETLSAHWPSALGSSELYRPFRVLAAFWIAMQWAAEDVDAELILADVGPNLGAINRSALIATDFVIVPLAADLYSLQGLRNLGPSLRDWRGQWRRRLENWPAPEFPLPAGGMKPLGYVVQQHGVRLERPVKAYDRWVNRIPASYLADILEDRFSPPPATPASDPNCLATLKHYRSLASMGQEARKPIFDLTAADGAIGSHASAAFSARMDFAALARAIIDRIEAARR